MSKKFNIQCIKNITFEGGGIAGVAYSGVLEVLEAHGLLAQVERVAGTSAGSSIALLLALGYTPKEIKAKLETLDFTQFQDPWHKVLRNSLKIFSSSGLYSGESFIEWFKQVIAEKTGNADITFAQLHQLRLAEIEANGTSAYKDPYIVAMDVKQKAAVIFSHEETCPYKDEPLWYGARASVSLPGFFMAVKTKDNSKLVDGGLILNDPQVIFDDEKYMSDQNPTDDCYHSAPLRKICEAAGLTSYCHNPETLALRMRNRTADNDSQKKRRRASPMRRLATASMNFIMNSYIDQSYQVIDDSVSHIIDRTIEVDKLGLSCTTFKMPAGMVEALNEASRQSTMTFLSTQEMLESGSYHDTNMATTPLRNKYFSLIFSLVRRSANQAPNKAQPKPPKKKHLRPLSSLNQT